jgi:hypothetical protein
MIVVDVEIKKAIRSRTEERLEGIEYCDGWRDFANMGIACVCTYDIVTHLTRVFLEEDLEDFQAYIAGKWTAGFNTVNFDNRLLLEHDIVVDAEHHYDILRGIWIALDLNPDTFNPRTHGGWGLDAVCQATLGIRKTGHGALAPVWWQQGKRGKVIDYCCNDVWMEGSLLLHVLQGKPVFNHPGSLVDGLHPVVPDEWASLSVTAKGRQYGAGQITSSETTVSATSAIPGGLGIVR